MIPKASGKVPATYERLIFLGDFLGDFPHQVWALGVVLLLPGSGPLGFESAVLCTFRHSRHFESDRGDS